MLRRLAVIAVSSFTVGLLSGAPAHSFPEDNIIYRAVVKLIIKYEELEQRLNELEEIVNSKLKEIQSKEEEDEEVSLAERGVVKTWLRFRSAPSLESEVLFLLRPNEEVEILEDVGDWLRVRTKEGYVGYVFASYILRKK